MEYGVVAGAEAGAVAGAKGAPDYDAMAHKYAPYALGGLVGLFVVYMVFFRR